MAQSIEVLLRDVESGVYDSTFKKLYVDDELIPQQTVRYFKALRKFESLYGNTEVEVYSASGRSEVGGNHTDHQHGKVLAAGVNIDTLAVVSKNDDNTVRLVSEGYEPIELTLDELDVVEEEKGTTKALIRGVAAGLKKRGYAIGGFDAYAVSDVLSGSGLSSSAAFEVLIGNVISGMFNEEGPDPVLIAQIGQEAENVYFGKPCGLMDQMACSVGGLIRIDFLDPTKPVITRVSVDFEQFGHSLCIIDTKGSHSDLTDDYAAIPQEMKKVAAVFGKQFLCEVDPELFFNNLSEVRREAGDRAVLRAIHFFNETNRVDELVDALQHNHFDKFKEVIKKSGDSSFEYLQNVYSNHKLSDMSMAVGIAVSEEILGGEGVTRVHGGGFAGTIQAFVPDELVPAYRDAMDRVFGSGACHVLKIRSIGGTRVM